MSNNKYTQKQTENIAQVASQVKPQVFRLTDEKPERNAYIVKLREEGYSLFDVSIKVLADFGERLTPQRISEIHKTYLKREAQKGEGKV